MVRIIQIGGRTPGGLSFNYQPGKLVAADGAMPERFVITPDGVEMSEDAANTARSQWPDDTRIVGVDDHVAQLTRKVGTTTQAVTATAEVSKSPESSSASSVVTPQGNVADMSSKELRTLASTRKIKGRSTMNKAELIAALS